MVQRILVSTLVALFVLFGTTAARAADDQTAQTFIQGLAQNAIATVAAQNVSDTDRNERFRKIFVSAFDIPEIGKFVLSRHWRAVTPAQQAAFLKEFEDTQVLMWSRRFKDYNGVSLETLGANKEGEATWLVDSQIIRPQAPPISVQWRVHGAADGSMRVIDIISSGISMVLTYRDDYASALKLNGGNVDALLAVMRAKNERRVL